MYNVGGPYFGTTFCRVCVLRSLFAVLLHPHTTLSPKTTVKAASRMTDQVPPPIADASIADAISAIVVGTSLALSHAGIATNMEVRVGLDRIAVHCRRGRSPSQ